MSVLNQSGEEQVECPLCMEPLEVDDLNFYPCTCGYQICRFCWHRIRTDENGLCPACRKAYSEDPADFIPLSQEQVAKLKAEKRQRDQQRKAKLSESRKHLASVRVVQRNLVFVVGLPMRLADPEVLKRHEYFGKFGKIHKVVINQSTSYAGSQGPSASAYVTYMKSDDALRAIQSVNNVTIDGRQIKSSLGTTKYCSHFMKNLPCPKPDCMYLHDFGDPEASFTKEQMHAGKHQEYEKKLHDALVQRISTTSSTQSSTIPSHTNSASPPISVPDQAKTVTQSKEPQPTTNGTNKENWPTLSAEKEPKPKKERDSSKENKSKTKTKPAKEKKEKKISDSSSQSSVKSEKDLKELKLEKAEDSREKLSLLGDNTSFFSHNFHKIAPEARDELESPTQPPSTLTDSFPDITTTEDWAAAFGFNKLENLPSEEPCPPPPIEPFFRGTNTSEEFRNLLEMSKLQDLREVLSNKTNGYTATVKQAPQDYFGKETTSFDQHMSKFFNDFHQKNGQKENNSSFNSTPMNGFNPLNNYLMSPDRLILLQQKKVEEHLLNFSMKNYGLGSHNHYLNGDVPQNGYSNHYHFQQPPQQINKTRNHSEDELDFDPFQETQKALAEIIASEQSFNKSHNGRAPPSQMNGVQTKSHVPPPPPGFVQPSTHMNSFGSKILPFLNMSNQQQQINPSTQNWPSYSAQMSQPQQHKNLNGCNDWKDFDSAIVTTSRHYPINMPPIRDHFASLQQINSQQQMSNGSLRSHDYNTNNTFSNFTQQLQPNYSSNSSSYPSHSTTQQPQNLSWFTNELNSQISSPPGFRSTNQTTKQQEC